MSNHIDASRNPTYQPNKPRPVSYFTVQIKDLFREAIPNMTPEQCDILSKLNSSLIKANDHKLRGKNDEMAVEKKYSNERKEKILATCKLLVDDFENKMTLISEGKRTSDELIIMKHLILQSERDLKRLKDQHALEFIEFTKAELRTMTREKQLKLQHTIEIEHLKTELVCLGLDVEAKKFGGRDSEMEKKTNIETEISLY